MHQALYRKWRPRSFDEVYGQDHITSILKYEVANSKFSHAYLFCGSRGTGKTTCAKILSRAVNCLSPVDGNPCGRCEACMSIESGSTTDILEMDAASNNSVEDIRYLRDEVIYSPSMLKYRVYIIDEVHMLSTSAFNALLKTLEEPPEHVVFILATTDLHKLPATIISRCQRFDFRRITTDVLKNHLMRIAQKEGIDINEGAATIIAKHAQGGMRDAISLLDLCAGSRKKIDEALVNDMIGSGGREKILSLVNAIADRDYDFIFSSVDEVVQSSKDIAVFWQDLISVYRDLLIVKSSKNSASYLDLTDNEIKALSYVAKKFTIERLSYHCSMLQDALASMLRANAVRRLVAELTLVRMCDERLSSSPEAMLSRIATLENSVPVGAGFGASASNEAQVEKNVKDQTKSKKTAPQGRAKYSDDDDMFRADAPSFDNVKPSQKQNEQHNTTREAPQGKENVRTLKVFKSKAEVMEMMDRRDQMLSSFFRRAKWYVDEQGKIVLRFASQFDIDPIKTFGGEKFFLDIMSSLYGKQYTSSDLSLEYEGEKKNDELIDRIIEAAEE